MFPGNSRSIVTRLVMLRLEVVQPFSGDIDFWALCVGIHSIWTVITVDRIASQRFPG